MSLTKKILSIMGSLSKQRQISYLIRKELLKERNDRSKLDGM